MRTPRKTPGGVKCRDREQPHVAAHLQAAHLQWHSADGTLATAIGNLLPLLTLRTGCPLFT